MDLSLPSTTAISPLLNLPLPTLPTDPSLLTTAMSSFTNTFLPFFDFLPPARCADLMERYLSAPASLAPDQTALVLGCLAMGCYQEKQTGSPAVFGGQGVEVMGMQGRRYSGGVERPDWTFFLWALRVLDDWGSASPTALGTFHFSPQAL
jgi:hypothetical protein